MRGTGGNPVDFFEHLPNKSAGQRKGEIGTDAGGIGHPEGQPSSDHRILRNHDPGDQGIGSRGLQEGDQAISQNFEPVTFMEKQQEDTPR
jgi:hypothetical protein